MAGRHRRGGGATGKRDGRRKLHVARPAREPYRWLGTGAVALGISAALLNGVGVAAADDGAGADSKSSTSSPDTNGDDRGSAGDSGHSHTGIRRHGGTSHKNQDRTAQSDAGDADQGATPSGTSGMPKANPVTGPTDTAGAPSVPSQASADAPTKQPRRNGRPNSTTALPRATASTLSNATPSDAGTTGSGPGVAAAGGRRSLAAEKASAGTAAPSQSSLPAAATSEPSSAVKPHLSAAVAASTPTSAAARATTLAAVPLSTAAVAPTAAAGTSAGAVSLPGLINTVVTGVLGLFGVGPAAGPNPLSPLGLSPLIDLTNAWFRRLEETFNNRTPTAAPTQISETATGVVTGKINAFDAEGDPLVYQVTSQPAHGTVTVDATGGWTYTPTIAEAATGGQDSFTVTVTEANAASHIHGFAGLFGGLAALFGVPGASDGSSVKAAVPVTITPINQSPVVGPVPFAVTGHNTATGVVTGTVAVTDPQGGSLTYAVSRTPLNGTVSVDAATGAWTYTPSQVALTQAYVKGGTDTAGFTITATNTSNASTAVTVTAPVGVDTASLVTILKRVGSTPSAVAVGPTGTIYVTNSGANTLSIVDPTTNTVTSTITVGKNPEAVAVGANGQVWVVNSGDNTVTVTNPVGSVLHTVTVGDSPSAITFGTDGSAFVANAGSGTVSVISASSYAVTNTVTVGSTPTGIATGPDGRVYTANYGDGSITIIDPGSGYATDGIVLTDARPYGIAVTNTGMIVVTDPVRGMMIELASVPTTSTMTTPVVQAVSAVTSAVAVTSSTDPDSVVISHDGAEYEVNGLTVQGNPTAITSDGTGTLYMANSGSDTVTVVNPATGAVSTVHVGVSPVAVATGANGTLGIVSADNTLTIIDSETGSTTTVPVGVDPYTVTADAYGNLTVSNNYDGTASVIPHPTVGSVAAGTVITGTVSSGVATTGTATQGTAVAGDSTATGWTVDTGAAGGESVGSSPDGRYAFVINHVDGTVSVINPLTGTGTVTAIPAAVGFGSWVAPSPDGRYAYVGNRSDGTASVSVIDAVTGTATAINTGEYSGPLVFGPDGRYAYVANYDGGTVSVIDPVTGTATSFNTGANSGNHYDNNVTSDGLVVSPDGRYAYVANYGAGTVSVINPATGTVTTIKTGAVVSGVNSLVVSPDGRYAYVANRVDGVASVSVINPATGTATTVKTGEYSGGLVVSPDGRYAYVANYADGITSVSVINPVTGTATTINTQTGTIDPRVFSGGLVVSPDGRYAYIANYVDGSVSIINPATGTATTVDTGPIDTATFERGLVVSPDGRYAYAINHSDGTVSIINPVTGTATTINTGGALVDDLLVSPDGRYAYATRYVDDTVLVSVIDPATGTATPVRTVGALGKGLTVSPDGKYAYVANPGDGAVAVINPVTGTATIINTGGALVGGGVVVSPDGRYAFAHHYVDGTVSVINPVTGTAATLDAGAHPAGLFVSPNGRYAYVLDFDRLLVGVSVIDPVTGSIATIPATGTGGATVAISPDSRYVYVTNELYGALSVIDMVKLAAVDIAPDDSISTYMNTADEADPTALARVKYSDVAVTGVSAPAHGTAVVTDGGIIKYTPNADYVGTDSFTYTAANGDRTGTGTISVTVSSHLSAAPDGYHYSQGPTRLGELFQRLWATTDHAIDTPNLDQLSASDYASLTSLNDQGMHIERVNDPANGDVRYVVYFGGTNFSNKMEGSLDDFTGRNKTFFESSTPFVDPTWFDEIQKFVGSKESPIMLVGFSQGGMDAQNIGAALSKSGYNVEDVITLASPVTQPPSTAYTTLNLTPYGDLVGDTIRVYPGNTLIPPLFSSEKSYWNQAADVGQVYEAVVGVGTDTIQHGELRVYLKLADKFDNSIFNQPTWSKVQLDVESFGGQVLVGDGQTVRVDDGTPGGTLVPVYIPVNNWQPF